jgi:hypothetical protein
MRQGREKLVETAIVAHHGKLRAETSKRKKSWRKRKEARGEREELTDGEKF